jgi:hypothetical protein
MTSVPGAARSTQSPELEKGSAASRSSVAPTVSTCGYDAGYTSGLPSSPLFPAAATTMQPARTAAKIAF